MIKHVENEYLLRQDPIWKKNYLSILWKGVSLNDRLFNQNVLYYIDKMYPIIETSSLTCEDFKLKGEFYYKIGGYKYLHISYKEGLKDLLLCVKYFKKIPKNCDVFSIDSQATLSYAYGRIGELLQRSLANLKDEKKQKRLLKALSYHYKSLDIIKEINNTFPDNMSYFMKMGVVYERIGQTYRLMNKTQKALKYFKLALEIKKEYFIKEDKSFGYRKILIVISDFYKENQMNKESYESILEAINLTNKDDLLKYIDNEDQYEIESYIKIYHRYCSIHPNSKYKEYLNKLLQVSKDRNISSEY
jgi:tetratricopeptide (TPR) repeat protein